MHRTQPIPNVFLFHYRYDPASPVPDYVAATLGEVCHLDECGHAQAVGCCPNVDRNGRHLLPRFRSPADPGNTCT